MYFSPISQPAAPDSGSFVAIGNSFEDEVGAEQYVRLLRSMVHMLSCRDDRHHTPRLGWVSQRPEERVDILAQHAAQNNLQRVAGSSPKVCFAVQPPNADFVPRVVGWVIHFVTYVTV